MTLAEWQAQKAGGATLLKIVLTPANSCSSQHSTFIAVIVVSNLFHACMGFLLKLLETLGITGHPMESGDGVVHNCHLIFAVYSGDYPEQTLATCTKNGECPTCPAPRDKMGNPQ